MVDGNQRHLVLRDPVDHGISDANRQRVPRGHVGMALLTFVALDATLHFILGLALAPCQFDTIDAAVACVDQVQVIDEPAEEAGSAGRVWPHAIALQREVLLVGQRAGYWCRTGYSK